MSTALDMIKRSMRLVGALGAGETLTDDEQTDGLNALNRLVESFSIQRLLIYRIQIESFTWNSGQTTQTIGSGGDFDTDRPERINKAWQRLSDIDYPITLLDSVQYAHLTDKTTSTNVVDRIYYEPSYPLGTLYAYPVPSEPVSIYLQTWVSIQSFPNASTAIALPAGYEDAIVFNLAMALAPEYQRPIPQSVTRRAAQALRTLKRHNLEVPSMLQEPVYVNRSRSGFDYRKGH